MRAKKAKVKISTTAKPKKNLTAIAIAGVVFIAAALGIFFLLLNMFKTSTYYVLRNDVAAKTQITTNMLVSQTTSAGTQPKNALSIQQVQGGNMYAKYALEKGDVISHSNVGALTQSTNGIPDSWVVTSFTANGNDSVNGRIQRGSYFDIIGITSKDGNSVGRYLFTDVLALDVTTTSTSDKNGNTNASYVYTVGMPQKDAALLHAGLKGYDSIKLVVSPKSVEYKKRNTTGLGDSQGFTDGKPGSTDLYKGTDSSFKAVKRDKKGRPITKKSSSAQKTESKSSSSDNN